MSDKSPTVIPMISYENGVAALEWLAKAFGFRERTRVLAQDGTLALGEMEVGDSVIMLASPSSHYESPKHHRETCGPTRRWLADPWIFDGVLVVVDDLEDHFGRARAAGAVILSNPESGPPGRRYRAEDCEGHRWFFLERAKESATTETTGANPGGS